MDNLFHVQFHTFLKQAYLFLGRLFNRWALAPNAWVSALKACPPLKAWVLTRKDWALAPKGKALAPEACALVPKARA